MQRSICSVYRFSFSVLRIAAWKAGFNHTVIFHNTLQTMHLNHYSLPAWVSILLFAASAAVAGCAKPQNGDDLIEIVVDETEKRADVLVDGALFTSYLYGGEPRKKAVLWPIISADGQRITRGYPIDPVPGEQVDHPHHLGMWLNYGDVNGLDFWNNSSAVSDDRASGMGTIVPGAIASVSDGELGVLEVEAGWVSPEGDVLLEEETRYEFRSEGSVRTIDRITTLTALDEPVDMNDNKEGMFAIRVTRALELPSDSPARLVGPDGKPMEERVVSTEGVTGDYLNSEGVTGTDVWGKRAKWCLLSGEMDGEPVSVAILDHPSNAGYPTYWHARGYGLFSANPLGQAALSDGEETLHFSLGPDESTTFRYRVLIISGRGVTADDVEAQAKLFAGS